MDADSWDRRYADSALVWSAEPNRWVAEHAADLAPGRAVDLGCGEGRNALWLAGRGWEVEAVDFSAVALDKGRALAERSGHGDRVRWRLGDATTWSGAGLDLAVLAYLQLAAPQRRAAVRAAYDALGPGGTFLLVAHDSTNLAEGTGGPQDPAVLMDADDVLADLTDRPGDAGPVPRVVHAGRVARTVAAAPDAEHRESAGRTAWDCLVRLVHP